MDGRSFQEILSEFLEEKTDRATRETTVSPSVAASFTPFEPLLNWQPPQSQQRQKNGYPPPTKRLAEKLEEKIEPKELFHAVKRLERADQLRVQVMERMGCTEFCEGISLIKLKKAHRRLVKQLHPDRQDASLGVDEKRRLHSQFLLLQEAYEGLERSLKKLNESVGDSESASAPASRRQDAA